MTEVSKTVADHLAISEQVLQAIEVLGGKVAEGIASGARIPRDVVLSAVIAWLGTHLRSAHDALRDADLEHAAELQDDRAPRDARDQITADLRGALISASSVVRGAYGESFSTAAGLEAAVEKRPDLVAAQAHRIARALRAGRAPATITEGVRVDLAALASSLEARASRLDDALSIVRREEREAQTAMSARDAALARWERTYAGVAEIFTGLCTLAGLDDLARKVRPTPRRRAGLPDDGGAPPGGGGEGDGGGGTTE
ncbi:hypothetical protein [Sandaracinus amylolyticus]|uniref:Uncharacterized protein n=1 Tax=Sandaracinus amylolyticus TaxID=927083 RepID=A0A0F6WA74_9BACT|nr:hypothetical protein [Sandaracinus amylolyticus]AKF11355.1 hypothetical protein DB32_008504 [Sandaracinus amylolyticus]